MAELYVDQAPKSTSFFDRRISSFYTPEGILRIDKRFMHRIMAFKEGKDFVEYSYSYSHKPPKKEVERIWSDTMESLTKDIKENPHLHPEIKANLLFNLRQ
jgi:hypothetical protein